MGGGGSDEPKKAPWWTGVYIQRADHCMTGARFGLKHEHSYEEDPTFCEVMQSGGHAVVTVALAIEVEVVLQQANRLRAQ